MKARLYHPKTGAPILPIGYRRNGSPIWPILGASEDETPPPADDADPEGDPAPEGDDDGEDEEPDPEGADQLGDPGKRALDAVKAKYRAERDRRRALEARVAELTASKPPAEGEPLDPEAIKAEARREVLAEANLRIVRTEVKSAAAAAGFNDPADAFQYLDLASFEVDDEGNIDPDELSEAISELVARKPYLVASAQGGRRFQGGADGGARKGSKPPTLDEQIAVAQSEGRVRDVIALQNRKLAEIAKQ